MTKFKHDIIIVAKNEISANCLNKKFFGFSSLFLVLLATINLNIFRSMSVQLSAITPIINEFMTESILTRTPILSGFIIVTSLLPNIQKEKIDRSVETLLCFPISLDAIWIGRVLALVVIYSFSSYLIGIIIFLSLNLMNLIIAPISLITFITLIIIPPLFGTGLLLMLTLLYWVTDFGKIGQFLLFGVFFIFFFIGYRPETFFGPWYSFFIYLSVGLVSGLIAFVLRKFLLNRERIILC